MWEGMGCVLFLRLLSETKKITTSATNRQNANVTYFVCPVVRMRDVVRAHMLHF